MGHWAEPGPVEIEKTKPEVDWVRDSKRIAEHAERARRAGLTGPSPLATDCSKVLTRRGEHKDLVPDYIAYKDVPLGISDHCTDPPGNRCASSVAKRPPRVRTVSRAHNGGSP